MFTLHELANIRDLAVVEIDTLQGMTGEDWENAEPTIDTLVNVIDKIDAAFQAAQDGKDGLTMTRRFYRHCMTFVVLSDEVHPSLDNMSIEDVAVETDDGDMVMHSVQAESVELTREQMDKALIEAGSDPDFFPADE